MVGVVEPGAGAINFSTTDCSSLDPQEGSIFIGGRDVKLIKIPFAIRSRLYYKRLFFSLEQLRTTCDRSAPGTDLPPA